MTLILNMFDIDVIQRRQSRRKKPKTHMHNAAEMKILDSTDLVFDGMLGK